MTLDTLELVIWFNFFLFNLENLRGFNCFLNKLWTPFRVIVTFSADLFILNGVWKWKGMNSGNIFPFWSAETILKIDLKLKCN